MTRELNPGADGRCGAKNRAGNPCGRPSGWGTIHAGSGRCKMHGGNTPSGVKYAQRIDATRAVAVYGLPREIDPLEALVEELHRTAGHVSWLGQIIREGEITEDASPTGRRRVVKLDQAVFGGGDQPSVWMDLYQRERTHFTLIAKECLRAGVEARRVELAEQQGALIAQVLRGVLADLGMAERPEVAAVVRKHLTLVAASG